jgi:hypothetical protein
VRIAPQVPKQRPSRNESKLQIERSRGRHVPC